MMSTRIRRAERVTAASQLSPPEYGDAEPYLTVAELDPRTLGFVDSRGFGVFRRGDLVLVVDPAGGLTLGTYPASWVASFAADAPASVVSAAVQAAAEDGQ